MLTDSRCCEECAAGGDAASLRFLTLGMLAQRRCEMVGPTHSWFFLNKISCVSLNSFFGQGQNSSSYCPTERFFKCSFLAVAGVVVGVVGTTLSRLSVSPLPVCVFLPVVLQVVASVELLLDLTVVSQLQDLWWFLLPPLLFGWRISALPVASLPLAFLLSK